VVHHHDGQTSEADPDPEEIGLQIGLEELLRIAQGAREARQQPDGSNQEDVPLETIEARWRSAGGTSASVALWLSCSARMYAAIAQRSRGGTWAA
jgi:hypothetical protein